MKLPSLLFLPAVIGLCSSAVTSCSNPGPTMLIEPEPTKNGYVYGQTQHRRDVLLMDFTKRGEISQNWNRLVSIGFVYGKSDPAAVTEGWVRDIKSNHPATRTEVKPLADGGYSLECWQAESERKPERAIRKVMRGPDGVYAISFAMKLRAFVPKEYEEWKRKILGAKLVKPRQGASPWTGY